jgi:hypothetical protein
MSKISEREKVEGVVERMEEQDGKIYRVKIFDTGLSKTRTEIPPFSEGMRVKKLMPEGEILKGTITERKMKPAKIDPKTETIITPEEPTGKVRVVWDGGGTSFEKVTDLKMIGIRRIVMEEE